MTDFQHIEPVYLTDHAEIEIDAKKVSIPKRQMQAFEDAVNPDLHWKTRVKRLLEGKNTAGKITGSIIDIGLLFTPFYRPVNRLRTLIKRNIMDTQEKPKYKSKTLWTFGLLFLVGLLQQVFGIELGLELSPDAQWVGIALSGIAFILRLVTGKPVKVGKLLKKLQER